MNPDLLPILASQLYDQPPATPDELLDRIEALTAAFLGLQADVQRSMLPWSAKPPDGRPGTAWAKGGQGT